LPMSDSPLSLSNMRLYLGVIRVLIELHKGINLVAFLSYFC
jgi:hypothetical protein